MKKTTLLKIVSIVICFFGLYLMITSLDSGLFGILYLAIGIWSFFGLNDWNIPSIPIHSLRHTHAVLLLETGTDMKYIQERLGHGSIQITSDVYAHISKKIELDNMDKFESYMESVYSEKNSGQIVGKNVKPLKKSKLPTK